MEEVDEFGIPIKQEVDEFGIPVKKQVDEFGIPIKAGVMDYVNAGIGAFNRGVSQVVSAPLKFLGALDETLSPNYTPEQEQLLFGGPRGNVPLEAGQAIQDFTERINPRIQGVNETFQSVGEGLGQAAGMIATAGVGEASALAQSATKVPSLLQATGQAAQQLGKTATSSTGVIGGAMTAVPEWEAAKEAGLSDEEAFQTLLKNYLVGQTEAIPIERLMVGLNRVTGGKILETVKLMGQQGITEGLQEGVQTYLTNEIAKSDYDPDRDPLFQVIESMKVGGIVGLILPGAMSIAKVASPEQRVKLERKLGELQADENIAEMSSGDPQLDVEIDAAASIDPVDKQVLEEVKVADAVKEEQKETEAEEKLELEKSNILPNAENTDKESGEKAEKEQYTAPSSTPEYKEAVAKVEKLQKAFSELSIEENADELLFELREARKSLQQIAGPAKDTRKKTPIQRQIEDATGVTKPDKTVKMTANEAIKHQVQTFYRGVEKGVKKGKDLANDLVSKVQEAVKEYPLSAKQTSQILTKLRRTNLFTPGSVSRLNTFIDKVATDAQYAEDLSTSQDLQSRVRKKAKTKVESIPRNYKAVARELGRIKPDDVDNLNEYQAIATEVIGGFADPKSNQYSPINETRVRNYITRINSEVAAKETQRVREEFGFGDEITDEEIQMLLDSEDESFLLNKEETKRKLTRDKILKVAEYAKLALDGVTSDENQSVINNLSNAPLDELSDGQLVEYVRTVDNIVENDEFSNTARIEAQVEAVNNARELLKLTKGKKGEIGVIKGSLYNVPMMFNAIYSNSEKAAKVQLYSGLQDVYNGGSRVESSEHELYESFQKEAKRIKEKHGKTPLDAQSQVRRGVFGTLVRFPKGADPIETLVQSKNIVAESIRRLKGNKDRVEIAEDAERAFEPFKNAQTIDEVFDIMKKVDPAALEMWKFFNNEFETKVKSKLKQNSEQIFNEDFVEEENYTPKVFEVVDSAQSGELDAERAFTSDLPSKPKQSKTAIKATNALPVGRALNFEFDNNMFRKFRESMYDIETSKPRMLFREFMRLPAASEILGGQENKQKLTETYRKSEEVQRGIGRDYSDASKLVDEVTGALRTLGYTAALGSVDQFVKQYAPVATNTMWNLGGDSGLFFSHIPKEADKLFNLYTIGQRGRRLGGAERGESIKYKIQSAYRNKILKATSKFHRLTEKGSSIFMYSLTQGDVSVAKRSWAAYYLKYLKDNGVDLKTVNLANEHTLQNDKIRREAASFAEQKVKETQVVSNPSELAKLLRTAPGAENWIKNIFIPFSTFAVNTKVRVIENIRQIRTNENKPEAYRALAGTMTEIALYSTIKYFVLGLAYRELKALAENAFDLEGDDDDDDFRFKQWYSAIFKDFFPLAIGTMGENLSVAMANRVAHLFTSDQSYDEWKQDKGETFYSYKGDSQSFDLGLYSVGLDRVQETVQDAQSAFTGETSVSTNFGERDVTLDQDQQKFLAFMLMLDAVSSMGFMDAGLYNTLRKIKREQLRKGESSSGRPQLRPRPRPRPARQLR